MKAGYVYIMAERSQRHALHWRDERPGEACLGASGSGLVSGFTDKHGRKLLVWYAAYATIEEARLRECR